MLFAAATRDPGRAAARPLATMAAFRGSRLVTVDAQYHRANPVSRATLPDGNRCRLPHHGTSRPAT